MSQKKASAVELFSVLADTSESDDEWRRDDILSAPVPRTTLNRGNYIARFTTTF